MWINLTPHPIVLHRPDTDHADDLVIPPSGERAVVVANDEPLSVIDGDLLEMVDDVLVITPSAEPGTVQGLPPTATPEERAAEGYEPRRYLVSAVVIAHPTVAGRDDVFAPGTGPADCCIRHPDVIGGLPNPLKGQVKAVTRFVRPKALPKLDADAAALLDKVLAGTEYLGWDLHAGTIDDMRAEAKQLQAALSSGRLRLIGTL